MPWLMVAAAILSIFSTALSFVRRPGRPVSGAVLPPALPTNDEGGAIAWGTGTFLVQGPGIMFQGNFGAHAYVHTVVLPGGGLGQQTSQDQGLYIGLALAICVGPIQDVFDVYLDNRPLYINSITSGNSVRTNTGSIIHYLYTDNTFWGPRADGAKYSGINGTFDIYLGDTSQVADPYLTHSYGSTAPAYRRLCYMVMRNSDPADLTKIPAAGQPYAEFRFSDTYGGPTDLPSIGVAVVVAPPLISGMTAGHNQIATAGSGGTDANPACWIWQVLTDNIHGLGLDTASLDMASFVAAAETLYTEGLGISMVVNKRTPAKNVIQDTLRHIDGVLQKDPTTGKAKLKLIRDDYTVSALPVFDESSIVSCDYERGTFRDTLNGLVVTYPDVDSDFRQRSFGQDIDAGIVQANGEVRRETLDYPGATNQTVAGMIWNRELRALSYPLAKFTLKMNRQAWALREGDPFRLRWPEYSITEVVVRCGKIDTGTIEDGTITVDCVEDVFSIGANPYPGVPAYSNFQETAVIDVPDVRIFQHPKYSAFDPEVFQLSLCAPRSTVSAYGYEIWSYFGGGTFAPSGNSNLFTPVVALNGAMGPALLGIGKNYFYIKEIGGLPPSIPLLTQVAPDYSAGLNLLCMVDDQIFPVSYVDLDSGAFGGTGSYRVVCNWGSPSGDGVYCLDTAAKAHADGAVVYFFRPYSASIGLNLDPGTTGTAHAKLLPYNRKGLLDIGAATDNSLVVNAANVARRSRVWCGQALQINGTFYPAHYGTSDVVISWQEQDRTDPRSYTGFSAGAINQKDPKAVGQEIRIYGDPWVAGVPTLKHTEAAPVASPFTYTRANQLADNGSAALTKIRVEVWNLGVDGQYSFDHLLYEGTPT